MLASLTSLIWLVVRSMMPAKMVLWCDIKKVEKATAKMRPRYFARSPISICRATKFIISNLQSEPRLFDEHSSSRTQKKLLLFRLAADALNQRMNHAVDQAILLDKWE